MSRPGSPKYLFFAIAATFLSAGCYVGSKPMMDERPNQSEDPTTKNSTEPTPGSANASAPGAPAPSEVATFGAGCFWCVEAVLEQLDGVLSVRSGYMGGAIDNPTYKQVCAGTSGHAEVVQVEFDPGRITFDSLLAYFWKLHDPTTPNRQGNDVGPQYRSAIFYHTPAQRETAEKSKKALDESGVYPSPAVTEISEASKFYEAEGYHQDYYRLNKSQPYCRYVIAPKLSKLGLEE